MTFTFTKEQPALVTPATATGAALVTPVTVTVEQLSTSQKVAAHHYLNMRQFARMTNALERLDCCASDKHTFKHTARWLKDHECTVTAHIAKFLDLLCLCDCDIVEYIDSQVWDSARRRALSGPAIHGQEKWDAFLAQCLAEARKGS